MWTPLSSAHMPAQGAVWSCVLNEEAVVAATASADFSTRLWNALTGDEVHQFQHSHIARTVAFARRSPRLLSAGVPWRSPHAVTWPAQQPQPVITKFPVADFGICVA